MQHVIYIPGLGDRYDGIRKLGLMLWRRKNTHVSLVPMNWLDPDETLEEKLQRIKVTIHSKPGVKVSLVGESAGGSMAIVASQRFKESINQTITLCGMNRGVKNVSPGLFKRNRAFYDAMLESEKVIDGLTKADMKKMLTVFSSKDLTVRPRNSLISGVASFDLKIPGHMFAILKVLFFQYSIITERI